jgi:hypothetical protein
MFLLRFAIFLLLSSVATEAAHAKSQATIFTPDKVANARENIAKYAWAQSYRNQVLGYAAQWKGLSDEQIWNLPVEQTIPRSIYVHKSAGCPIHGSALIDRYGVYGWKVDPVNRPWKVQCPIGGETWPTNDFAKYRQSGLDAKHVFQPSLADRSLLSSTDPNRNYGVDDGTGYVDDSGRRFSFVAFYAHWGVWQNIGRSWSQALVNLSEAYVLTGDPVYAHKAAILLSRIADLLPSMDTNYWSSRGYEQGDGNSGRGIVLGSIWDAALGSAIARAYDAIYPALANDPALFTFLAAKSSQYGLTSVNSVDSFEQHIGKNALTVLLNAIQARRLRANEGIHQRTYAEAAIALDDPLMTPQWLNWLNQPGTVYDGGGHLPTILLDYIDRDGGTDEASPGYTAIWLEAIEPLAALLEESPYAAGYSLTQYPNFRNLLGFPFWLQLTPDYYPHIGDESKAGNPGLAPGTDPNRFAAAFHRYGFPELAQMAYAMNGNSAAGLHGSIYDPGADQTATAINAVIASHGPLQRKSGILSGYGLAHLDTQAGGEDASVWLYSGRQNKHGHWDRLNLGMFAYGLDLLPDLGYPDFPNVDSPNYWGWQNNTVAHNTVVVDASRQGTVKAGATKAFLASHPVKVVEVDGNGVYSQAGTYMRSVIQVPTAKGFYLVDIFRIHGGSDHLYSFHAGPGSVRTSGLNLAAQSGGTYAGANVAFGQFYDGACCTSYMGSGFQFLDSVARDNAPAGHFQAEWSVADHWGVLPAAQDTRLKIWSAGDKPASVAFANGHPPSNKPGNPTSLRYLLERRTGTAPLSTTFVHIIEPFVSNADITNVQTFSPVPALDSLGLFQRVGLTVTHADGSVDTIVHSISAGPMTANGLQLEGRGALVRRQNGEPVMAYLLAGKSLADSEGPLLEGDGVWKGSIIAIDNSDAENVQLTIAPPPPEGSWKNRYLQVFHGGGQDPFYRIEAVTIQGDVATVNLGRTNLVRGHVNPSSYVSGYLWDVAVGDAIQVQSDAYATSFDETEPAPEPTPDPEPVPEDSIPKDPAPPPDPEEEAPAEETTPTETTTPPPAEPVETLPNGKEKKTGKPKKSATVDETSIQATSAGRGCSSGGSAPLAPVLLLLAGWALRKAPRKL